MDVGKRKGEDVWSVGVKVEVGRWGDREVGRWGDREVGRWGSGEVGEWGGGGVGSWGHGGKRCKTCEAPPCTYKTCGHLTVVSKVMSSIDTVTQGSLACLSAELE